MHPNRFLSYATTALLLIVLFVGILSCGDISDEETTDRIRFTEFVLFPTSPYVDKSYIEQVPADDVAFLEIDFDAEKAAIQQVYNDFYNAYNDRSISTFSKILHKGINIDIGFYYKECDEFTNRATNWTTVNTVIQASWIIPSCPLNDPKWGPNPTLKEFYIRPKNISALWDEASVKGFNCWNGTTDRPGETYIYLVKINNKWLIYQLASLSPEDAAIYNGKPPLPKYFNDSKYKAP